MRPFEPACLATGIGSLPHEDAGEACRLVLEGYRRIPFWPQLPRRHTLENMYFQFAESLPGVSYDGGKLVIDTSGDFELLAAEFYEKYLASADHGIPLEPERAAGFWEFLETASSAKPLPDGGKFFAVKGHVTGPISYGLVATDRQLKPILYNDLAMDIISKNVAMAIRWQEDSLQVLGAPTIMFLDEPSMASYGSAFFNFGSDLVLHYLKLATEGAKSLLAVHCCGNTDWSILMDSQIAVLSFDAYGYADKMLIYSDMLGDFLQRGGALAVGMVPAQWEQAKDETPEQLFVRLERFYGALGKRGIDEALLMRRTLITPSCGLGSQPVSGAETIVRMTASLSALCRQRFGLEGKEAI